MLLFSASSSGFSSRFACGRAAAGLLSARGQRNCDSKSAVGRTAPEPPWCFRSLARVDASQPSDLARGHSLTALVRVFQAG